VALAAALAAGFLLAGCSTTGDSASVEAGAPAVSNEMGTGAVTEDMAVTKEGAAVPTTIDRQVIRTGYMSMRVEDVKGSAFEVHGLVAKYQGVISSEDLQSTDDSSYATITAQIPADKLDAFIQEVSGLGTVDSVNVSAQDVTSQVVDLDARIAALETSIDRLTELLAQATRIEDLLTIETQLAQRQAELDALKAQRTWLADQVAMSTISVSLSPLTQIAEVDAPGFVSGLQSGWAAFLSLIMVAFTALGFFLPFLIVLAIIAIPVTIVLVRVTRRHRHPVPATTSPVREEADADQAT
jgi:cell division protein FtsB